MQLNFHHLLKMNTEMRSPRRLFLGKFFTFMMLLSTEPNHFWTENQHYIHNDVNCDTLYKSEFRMPLEMHYINMNEESTSFDFSISTADDSILFDFLTLDKYVVNWKACRVVEEYLVRTKSLLDDFRSNTSCCFLLQKNLMLKIFWMHVDPLCRWPFSRKVLISVVFICIPSNNIVASMNVSMQ